MSGIALVREVSELKVPTIPSWEHVLRPRGSENADSERKQRTPYHDHESG